MKPLRKNCSHLSFMQYLVDNYNFTWVKYKNKKYENITLYDSYAYVIRYEELFVKYIWRGINDGTLRTNIDANACWLVYGGKYEYNSQLIVNSQTIKIRSQQAINDILRAYRMHKFILKTGNVSYQRQYNGKIVKYKMELLV